MKDEIIYTERIIAGGPHDFMEVHHVVLRGSNYAIGRKIAEIAKEQGVQMLPDTDTLRNRMQREYIRKHYPALFERMKGIADAFGEELGNDGFDFSGIVQYPASGIGCSNVFYPAHASAHGHSMVSRNFDFTTGTAHGTIPEEGEMALLERPYLFEMYPEKGYASLAICGYDLLGGVFDGLNDCGVSVSVLGDEESMGTHGLQPSNGVGLHELLSMRYVLDNCRNTGEAKEALLSLKHYYGFLPCHYLVADASGRSFVFEFSSLRNGVHIIDGKGIQIVTNHLLHAHASTDDLPQGDGIEVNSFRRYERLHALTQKGSGFSIRKMKEINEAVANEGVAFDRTGYAPNRTLWHSLHDLDDRSLAVKFYLGEQETSRDCRAVRYSEYTAFALK